MKVPAGSVIIPFTQPDIGTMGIRVAWDGDTDIRRIRRAVRTNYFRATKRMLSKRDIILLITPKVKRVLFDITTNEVIRED